MAHDPLRNWYCGQTVLVTGAAGSIGSQLAHQLQSFPLKKLILLDQSEVGLFELASEIDGPHIEWALADILHAHRWQQLLEAARPTVILHAAAYKHVPLLESQPVAAFDNIVRATVAVAQGAERIGAHTCLLVSTDKAVDPTSVMGACKRVGECYFQAMGMESRTRFITVRFGNVFGSSGSVVPIFQRQIAARQPVTVTHPEARRYFMTIPEAAELILHGAAMGCGGEVFALKMGEPVRILDLARRLIAEQGLRPGDDIPIRFTGLRPGEKLCEELAHDFEECADTSHPRIEVIRSSCALDRRYVERVHDAIGRAMRDPDSIGDLLRRLVPAYTAAAMTDQAA